MPAPVRRPHTAPTVKADEHHFERSLAKPVSRPAALAVVRTDELWDRWQAAEVESGVALCAWATCPDARKSDAYGEYLSALDREQRAAELLAGRVELEGWR